jgi:two-component system, sensor histidine kinase SagS
VVEKPRLLVIDRDSPQGKSTADSLSDLFERVSVRTISKALVLLRDQKFDAVFVDASQLSAVRWVGMLIQAEEILDAISDGVAVVDPDLRIIWANPEFHLLADSSVPTVGANFYKALGSAEILGPDPCPFTTAVAAKAPASTAMKVAGNRYLRLSVTPVFDATNTLTHLIALTRETTDETQQQLKVDAIHEAGDELADLTPAELAEMAVEERTDLLKYNIARHMKDLLGLDFMEIRILDRATNRLIPLLTEGMTPLAANRELYARKEGNGVTGFVAATGQSYVCPDTTRDPLYLEGAAGSRSSLTVPLIIHGSVIGTLNVESPQPDAFDDRDRQFIEIYGRNIAAALNTLELLQAEKASTLNASLDAINRELALPLDDIITDATTVLDRYAGHDEDHANPARTRAALERVATARRRRRRGDPPVGAPSARLPRCQRRNRPRRARSDRLDAANPLLRGLGRHPLARHGWLRDVQSPARSAAQRADHSHDRLRLGSHSLDREGAPGGSADRAVQAVPGRSSDGGRGTGATDLARRSSLITPKPRRQIRNRSRSRALRCKRVAAAAGGIRARWRPCAGRRDAERGRRIATHRGLAP